MFFLEIAEGGANRKKYGYSQNAVRPHMSGSGAAIIRIVVQTIHTVHLWQPLVSLYHTQF